MPTVISTSPATNQQREAFFKALFGSAAGYVCIAFRVDAKLHQEFFQYPAHLNSMLEYINRSYHQKNLYFCPQLLRERRRIKESVLTCTCLWADLDECDPGIVTPEPNIVLESSPGRWQAFWLLDRKTDPLDAEEYCHRLAYKYKDFGADQSGWDLSQLLRVPVTYNMKYAEPGSIPVVTIRKFDVNKTYKLEDFAAVWPVVPGYDVDAVPLPDISGMDPDFLLETHRDRLESRIHELYVTVPQKDWSTSLWALEMGLLEAGVPREEVLVICNAAKCNKFARDKLPITHLWKDILRAEARLKARYEELEVGIEVQTFLTDEERLQVESADETFVERFTAWAKTRGDAAPQYFQAGALTILSHLLSSVVRLPTSFGTMTLNLWFMILADTTLTRKSTAMEMAMDLLIAVDPDAILATDGSLEGLLTAIATRPNRSGIFWRDEFSGLLEAIRKKDYYAGMLEALTKLYDGKYQKRILRKETIEVKDPILLIFCGGIRSRILELMDMEHILSGFAPRFIFVQASSKIELFREIGPMTIEHDSKQSELLMEMTRIKAKYDGKVTMTIGEQEIAAQKEWKATLTPEAWKRYNRVEKDLVRYGIESNRPEVFTPMFDRLAKSALKTAVLVAASRQVPEDTVVVEEIDVLRAIFYMERWMADAIDVIESVGKTAYERRLDAIYKAVARKNGITRSALMQNYHLSSREADVLFETLEQRGLVRRVSAGGKRGTETLFPVVLR